MKENNIDYIKRLLEYYGMDFIEEKEVKKGLTKKILFNLQTKNGQKFTINSTEKEILNL